MRNNRPHSLNGIEKLLHSCTRVNSQKVRGLLINVGAYQKEYKLTKVSIATSIATRQYTESMFKVRNSGFSIFICILPQARTRLGTVVFDDRLTLN